MTTAYSEYPFGTSQESCADHYLLPTLNRICERFAANLKVCDLGCGNGAVLAALKRPGWEAHGVDLSESGVKYARTAHPEIHFHQRPFDDSLVHDLGSNRFDLVISTEVVEHLYAPRELSRVAHALLRPGGNFLLSTPYHG